MVTACKMDLEMENLGQTIAEAWNRHYLTSLAVFFPYKTKKPSDCTKNKSNSRIKKQKSFLKPANY
jgi:hypothetical protein